MLWLFVNQANVVNVDPVPAEEFSNRIVEALMVLTEALGGIILPLVGFGLMVSIGLYVMGSVFKSETLRKAGGGGIASCFIGGFLYFAIPTIMGLFKTIATIFR